MSAIKIKNILCFSGETEVKFEEGLNIVSGQNSAGKSSIATIIAALASHHDNPASISSRLKQSYITDGSDEGYAQLDNEVRWSPVSGLSIKQGTEPQSQPHCVGIVDFVKVRSAKERLALFDDLIPKKDPLEQLTPLWKRPKEQLHAVVDMINKNGWNDAIKMYEGQRLEAKKRWQKVTGRPRYGKEIASNWVPDGWSADLDGKSEIQLQRELADAQDVCNALLSAEAITQQQIDDAKKLKSEIPVIEDKLELLREEHKILKGKYNAMDPIVHAAEKEWTKVKDEITQIKYKLEHLKNINNEKQACPYCSETLHVSDGRIEKIPADTTAKIDELVALTDELKKERDRRKAQSDEAKASLNEVQKTIERVKNDGGQLKARLKLVGEMSSKADQKPASKASDAEVSLAQNKLTEAKTALECYKKWTDAKREHENVTEIDEVCYLLQKISQSQDALGSLVGKIQQILDNLCSITNWLPIKIKDDYAITSGGRPVQLCAQNEKLKAQWVIQIAIARITNSSWLVLDCCDLLQDSSWDGLIPLVRKLAKAHPAMKIVLLGTNIYKLEKFDEDNVIKVSNNHDINYV